MSKRIKRKFNKNTNIRTSRSYRDYRTYELKEERHILNQMERDRKKSIKNKRQPLYKSPTWNAYLKHQTIYAKSIREKKYRNDQERKEINRINEICRKRKERREVLFAHGRGGGGNKIKNRKFNEDSKVRC